MDDVDKHKYSLRTASMMTGELCAHFGKCFTELWFLLMLMLMLVNIFGVLWLCINKIGRLS